MYLRLPSFILGVTCIAFSGCKPETTPANTAEQTPNVKAHAHPVIESVVIPTEQFPCPAVSILQKIPWDSLSMDLRLSFGLAEGLSREYETGLPVPPASDVWVGLSTYATNGAFLAFPHSGTWGGDVKEGTCAPRDWGSLCQTPQWTIITDLLPEAAAGVWLLGDIPGAQVSVPLIPTWDDSALLEYLNNPYLNFAFTGLTLDGGRIITQGLRPSSISMPVSLADSPHYLTWTSFSSLWERVAPLDAEWARVVRAAVAPSEMPQHDPSTVIEDLTQVLGEGSFVQNERGWILLSAMRDPSAYQHALTLVRLLGAHVQPVETVHEGTLWGHPLHIATPEPDLLLVAWGTPWVDQPSGFPASPRITQASPPFSSWAAPETSSNRVGPPAIYTLTPLTDSFSLSLP
jgi:hypothetical protein